MDINFTCAKCGNTTYFIANNEYENILICKKCCESHFMSYRKLSQEQYKPHCPVSDTPTAKARWVLIYIHFQIYSKTYKTNELL